MPHVLHKAWEAPRLRALNEVLGVELQPEELLLEAVEAPWREKGNGEAGGVEVEGQVGLQPGGPAPKGLRDNSKDWATTSGGIFTKT